MMTTNNLMAQGMRFPTYDNKTHTAEQQPFADLSQKIWDMMAAKDAEGLKAIFHPNCEFVHMGGYWGTEQELATIGGGMIWYKHAEVYGVEVKMVNKSNVAVYSTIVLDAELGGQTTSHPFFVTQVFNNEEGAWKLISFVFTTRTGGPGVEMPNAPQGGQQPLARPQGQPRGGNPQMSQQSQERVGAQFPAADYKTPITPTLTLNNGVKMPQFGIGTFLMPGNDACYDAVLTALRMGYRHIDTAHAYQDEQGVGRAVNDFCKESGVKRSEIWVTSKLWPSEYAQADAIDKMLARMGLDYIDLLYPHQPVGDFKTAWHNMEAAVKAGKVRCLGLSNFEVKEAQDAYRWCVDSTSVKPVILQMECHPYAQRVAESAQVRKDGMVVECWYPLGGQVSNGALLRDPVINSIANKRNITPAQVILAWHIQEGHSIIPKSDNPKHIQENIESLNIKLTDAEMKQMRDLNREKRFYEFNIEQTRQFVNFSLPDEQAGGDGAAWNRQMSEELERGNKQ